MIDPISTIAATTAIVNETITLLNALVALLAKLGVFAASAVSVSAVIAKYLPPPEPGSKWATIYKFINAMAQNSRYAENK